MQWTVSTPATWMAARFELTQTMDLWEAGSGGVAGLGVRSGTSLSLASIEKGLDLRTTSENSEMGIVAPRGSRERITRRRQSSPKRTEWKRLVKGVLPLKTHGRTWETSQQRQKKEEM